MRQTPYWPLLLNTWESFWESSEFRNTYLNKGAAEALNMYTLKYLEDYTNQNCASSKELWTRSNLCALSSSVKELLRQVSRRMLEVQYQATASESTDV